MTGEARQGLDPEFALRELQGDLERARRIASGTTEEPMRSYYLGKADALLLAVRLVRAVAGCG